MIFRKYSEFIDGRNDLCSSVAIRINREYELDTAKQLPVLFLLYSRCFRPYVESADPLRVLPVGPFKKVWNETALMLKVGLEAERLLTAV
jgi:hypothetical protein